MDHVNSNKPFGHMVATDTPENIYYADLFKINGFVWMIMGYGKSDAARRATNKIHELDIARDSVAIVRDGDTLYARYDPGAHTTLNPELHTLHKLDAIAYCLNEEQSVQAFDDLGDEREIADAGNEVLGALCASYMYPACFAPHFFPSEKFTQLSNPRRMRQQFLELTSGISTTAFLLVPHMSTVEDKAALYRDFELTDLFA